MAINITLPPYSADPTGATDSTAAINAALAVDSIFGPAGTYAVSSPLNVLRGNTILTGEGPATIFKTNNPTADVFCVGNGSSPSFNVNFRDFAVASSVVKTAGSAFNCRLMGRSNFSNIHAQAPEDATPRLFNGITLAGYDNVKVFNCNLWNLLNNGIFAYGDTASNLRSGLWVSQATNITGAGGSAIYIAGNSGGVYLGDATVSASAIGVRIDQSASATMNRELFMTNGFSVDSSNSYNVFIGTNALSDIIMNGVWLASSGFGPIPTGEQAGMFVDPSNTGLRGQISGCKIYNNKGYGVALCAGSWNLSGNRFDNNGIGLGGVNPGLYIPCAGVYLNATGNTFANNADFGVRATYPVVGTISANTYCGNAAGAVLYGTLPFAGDVRP